MARRARALTLIEALVLGGLLLLLAALVVPQVRGARIAANETEAVEVLRFLRHACLELLGRPDPPDAAEVAGRFQQTYPDGRLLPPPPDGGPALLSHHGYLFTIWPLPAREGKPPALRIYGWPQVNGSSGTATFCLDEEERLLFTRNLRQRYSGLAVRPDPAAALPRLGAKPDNDPDGGHMGQDDQRWLPLPAA